MSLHNDFTQCCDSLPLKRLNIDIKGEEIVAKRFWCWYLVISPCVSVRPEPISIVQLRWSRNETPPLSPNSPALYTEPNAHECFNYLCGACRFCAIRLLYSFMPFLECIVGASIAPLAFSTFLDTFLQSFFFFSDTHFMIYLVFAAVGRFVELIIIVNCFCFVSLFSLLDVVCSSWFEVSPCF